MRVQHAASVLVTDGRKALLLSNDGDAEFPNLRLVQKWEQDLPPDRELKSAAPGHAFSSHASGTRRSAYDETDFHEQAEAEFASKIAELLNDHVRNHSSEQLIIVAPPRTLGAIRKHLRSDVADRVCAEIAKDLVKHPIASIEQHLAAHR